MHYGGVQFRKQGKVLCPSGLFLRSIQRLKFGRSPTWQLHVQDGTREGQIAALAGVVPRLVRAARARSPRLAAPAAVARSASNSHEVLFTLWILNFITLARHALHQQD